MCNEACDGARARMHVMARVPQSCPRVGWTRGSGRVGSGPGHDFAGFWRVGSGRVGSGHDFAGFWRVGSGRVSTSDLKVFF